MSYQEKRTISIIVTTMLVLAAYCIIVYGRYRSGILEVADLKSWASIMLIFVGIGIVATIIIQIIFHILLSIAIAAKEVVYGGGDPGKIDKAINASFVQDEMDKLIELKSSRFNTALIGGGFLVALGSLVFGFTPVVLLNIIFVSYSLGMICEHIVRLVYYRSGISNG